MTCSDSIRRLPSRREVFLQKSSVNLLSPVMDTPEFFWRAPDQYRTLYDRCGRCALLPSRCEC